MKKSTALFLNTRKNLVLDRAHMVNRIKTLDKKRKSITSLLNKLKIVEHEYTSVFLHAYSDSIDISINLRRLDSFKDARLTNVLSILEDLNPTKVSSSEYPEWTEKTYRYKLDDFIISVTATVRSDSPICRRVVEEVKMVEEFKYKLVCD